MGKAKRKAAASNSPRTTRSRSEENSQPSNTNQQDGDATNAASSSTVVATSPAKKRTKKAAKDGAQPSTSSGNGTPQNQSRPAGRNSVEPTEQRSQSRSRPRSRRVVANLPQEGNQMAVENSDSDSDQEEEGEVESSSSSSESSSSSDEEEISFHGSQNNNAQREEGTQSEELDYEDDVEQVEQQDPQTSEVDDTEEDEAEDARLRTKRKKKRAKKRMKKAQQSFEKMMDCYMTKRGIIKKNKDGKIKDKLQMIEDQYRENRLMLSPSEATVYRNAVQKSVDLEPEIVKARNSTSSDDLINTSDEMLPIAHTINTRLSRAFQDDCRIADDSRQRRQRDHSPVDECGEHSGEPFPRVDPTVDDGHARAEQMIREAEKSKARIHEVSGRIELPLQYDFDITKNYVHSSMVDEEYMLITAHVDEGTKRRIISHKYVDFSRLLARDRILMEEDHRMEMVSREGRTYFVPVQDRDVSNIGTFSKWEQAFRVFVHIYTCAYPGKASELIQYNHLIHTASLSFAWDNVYLYDKDFRMHLSKHPGRSWAIILQQSWTLRLKDRYTSGGGASKSVSGDRSGRKRDICYRFNREKCSEQDVNSSTDALYVTNMVMDLGIAGGGLTGRIVVIIVIIETAGIDVTMIGVTTGCESGEKTYHSSEKKRKEEKGKPK